MFAALATLLALMWGAPLPTPRIARSSYLVVHCHSALGHQFVATVLSFNATEHTLRVRTERATFEHADECPQPWHTLWLPNGDPGNATWALSFETEDATPTLHPPR